MLEIDIDILDIETKETILKYHKTSELIVNSFVFRDYLPMLSKSENVWIIVRKLRSLTI